MLLNDHSASNFFLVKHEIEKFRGIGGVRIEDDVLITPTGNHVLSHKCPKEIDQIERILMNKTLQCKQVFTYLDD